MDTFDLLSFRKQIVENNIILSFEGKMSQGVLVSLVETLKERLQTKDDNASDSMHFMTRKIYAIFVELAQNIQNHSLERATITQQDTGSGIIVIREGEQCLSITSGNNMLIDDAKKLGSYCQHLNQLSDHELKQLFKEKLRMARKESSKGAGLGLIEMVRKSGNPLRFEMQPLDEQTLFFSLSVNLTKAN